MKAEKENTDPCTDDVLLDMIAWMVYEYNFDQCGFLDVAIRQAREDYVWN